MATTSKVGPIDNIFTVTERGDRKIMEAHEHAIIFVGLTRVGKSTVFNWVLKKPMIGKGNLNSYFIPQVAEDGDVAIVGNSFASVTLAPNIYKDYEPKLSLVDMAGYEDTRNYVGVIGVSYFLKALFEKVRKAKFVIVFDENKFTEQACAGLIKTFQGFINMFNFSLMTDEIKKKIKNSLSVIVTRAKSPEHHYGYIEEILQKMQDPTFLFDNKSLIMQILEQMKDSARVQAFKAAKDKQNPDQCTFISKFNQRGWRFFDFDQNEAEVGQTLIALPFTRDYQKLGPDQKETFIKELENKINYYLQYSDILKKLVQNFVRNWEIFSKDWSKGKAFTFSSLGFNELFQEVQNFVQNNDVYGSTSLVNVQLKVNYQTPSFIKSIKSILKLQDIVIAATMIQDFQEIEVQVVDPISKEVIKEKRSVNLTFKDTMDKFKGYFAEMIKIIKIFASSREQEILLERTNFILQRGFREFQKLYELDPQLIHDIRHKLLGNCNSVFELDSIKFMEQFINTLNDDLLIKLFPSLEALVQYQNFFKEFSTKKLEETQGSGTEEEKDKVNIFLNEHKCTIEMVKADLLFGLMEKEKALECFINALKNIISITGLVNGSLLYDQQAKNKELNKLSMKKLKLIKKIVSVLKSVSDSNSNNYITYALQLSKHHNMIEQTCQIYEIIITNSSSNEKLKLYKQFSQYCVNWGRFEYARILLQKKLQLEEDSYEDYNSTANSLRKLQADKVQNENLYASNLRTLGKLKVQDSELDIMLAQIENEVKKQIEINQSIRIQNFLKSE